MTFAGPGGRSCDPDEERSDGKGGCHRVRLARWCDGGSGRSGGLRARRLDLRNPPWRRGRQAGMTVDESLGELRRSLAGRALALADPGYDVARICFNALVDRRPAVIVQCVGPADVATAFDFAR